MKRENLLFIIIFLEGFVVLATELLAIRLLMPFVGNGTEVLAIIISAVLLPLAFGYNKGGSQDDVPTRKRLNKNLVVSVWFLVFGLSYVIHEIFFALLNNIGIKNHIFQTTIFCLVFIVYPVFLLAQTVPLISNYFSKRKLSEITGRILFFSTSGSFIGSVFTTLVLMMVIGVHKTVCVVVAALFLIIVMLNKKVLNFYSYFAVLALMFCIFLNVSVFGKLNFVSNNAYNMIAIKESDISRDMLVNRSLSSRLSTDSEKNFSYLRFIEKSFINNNTSKNILIIGAGGFTIGLNDSQNHYTFVDVDPEILKVSEREFLKKKLGDNKKFVAMSARAFLNKTQEKYDLIILDAYTHVLSLPLECTTREFYMDVKNHLGEQGVVIANIIALPNFDDKFSTRIHNTFASVFSPFSREVLTPDGYTRGQTYANIMYVYQDRKDLYDDVVYTDDKNSYSIDRKVM